MRKITNVIIAGTRTFTDYKLVCTVMNVIRQKYGDIQIIVGGCKGADKCGELYAIENKIPYKVYNAEWKKYGKRAGPLRNEKMSKVGNVLVLFWDYESSGSEDMLHLAVREELDLYVMLYRTNEFYAGKNVIDKVYNNILPF
jgi:hypothetical protein